MGHTHTHTHTHIYTHIHTHLHTHTHTFAHTRAHILTYTWSWYTTALGVTGPPPHWKEQGLPMWIFCLWLPRPPALLPQQNPLVVSTIELTFQVPNLPHILSIFSYFLSFLCSMYKISAQRDLQIICRGTSLTYIEWHHRTMHTHTHMHTHIDVVGVLVFRYWSWWDHLLLFPYYSYGCSSPGNFNIFFCLSVVVIRECRIALYYFCL